MRYIIILFSFITICSCHYASENKVIIKDNSVYENQFIYCDQNYDSILFKYATEFNPITIDLNSSLSPDLKSFLLSVDTNCLRKQAEYRFFIILILEKLALYHLKCCNQNYDLYQMREGAASVIINEFSKLAGYEGKRIEMLNSGLITDYLESNRMLLSNPTIANIMDTIKSEEKRIEKGL